MSAPCWPSVKYRVHACVWKSIGHSFKRRPLFSTKRCGKIFGSNIRRLLKSPFRVSSRITSSPATAFITDSSSSRSSRYQFRQFCEPISAVLILTSPQVSSTNFNLNVGAAYNEPATVHSARLRLDEYYPTFRPRLSLRVNRIRHLLRRTRRTRFERYAPVTAACTLNRRNGDRRVYNPLGTQRVDFACIHRNIFHEFRRVFNDVLAWITGSNGSYVQIDPITS